MKDKGPIEKLAKLDRGRKELWLDGKAKDFSTLEEFSSLETLSLYSLSKSNLEILKGISLPKLKHLGVRLAPLVDLQAITQFNKLDTLTVWQCSKLKSLEGMSEFKSLTILHLSDVVRSISIDEISSLSELDKLQLTGSVNQKQYVVSFDPIVKLDKKFSELRLMGCQSDDGKLSGLSELPEPGYFDLTPFFFSLDEVAILAASFDNWKKHLLETKNKGFKKCKECGTEMLLTFARRARAMCPKCQKDKFAKFEVDFIALVDKYKGS